METAVKQLAEELGVKWDEIEGTGPEGKVTDADVIAHHAKGGVTIPLVSSNHIFFDQCDATRILQLKENLEKKGEKGALQIILRRGLSLSMGDREVLICEVEGMFAIPSQEAPVVLAVAKVRWMPAVRNGEMAAKQMLPLTWSFDAGTYSLEEAGKMVASFSHLIENPVKLL